MHDSLSHERSCLQHLNAKDYAWTIGTAYNFLVGLTIVLCFICMILLSHQKNVMALYWTYIEI